MDEKLKKYIDSLSRIELLYKLNYAKPDDEIFQAEAYNYAISKLNNLQNKLLKILDYNK
jgi:hypothetical protein